MTRYRHAAAGIVAMLLAISGPSAGIAQEATPSPEKTPPPSQEESGPDEASEPETTRTERPGWHRAGEAPRKRAAHSPGRSWGEGQKGSDPWELKDPNEDAVFVFPTGRTLERGRLTLGFPGPGGIPDIQYGLTDWLQIGAGYSLIGFTPQARLGLIRGRRVDFTLMGGAYLPAGASHPFVGQYGGGMLSAGRDEFRVHLGYQYVQLWGDPFPDVRSVEGGLGMTGVEIKIAPRAKFLFMVANYAQINAEEGTEPFYAVGVAPGIRLYGKDLSADLGLIAGQVYNLKMARDEEPRNGPFVLPMFTLRYQM